jgi:hypothetical protein
MISRRTKGLRGRTGKRLTLGRMLESKIGDRSKQLGLEEEIPEGAKVENDQSQRLVTDSSRIAISSIFLTRLDQGKGIGV